jgi:amino acid permease
MFKKDISALRKFAFIGVISVLIFIFSVILAFFIKFKNNEIKNIITSDMLYPKGNYAQFFASFSAIINSLSFHQNCFPIYLQIKERNSNKMIKATFFAAIVTGIIYWIIAILGYSMYGNVINDVLITYFYNDIQTNLNKNKIISFILIISEITFFLQASFSLPLLFFALKSSLFNLLISNKSEKKNNEIELEETNNLSNKLVKKDNEEKSNNNLFKKNLIIVVTYCLILIFGIFFEKVLVVENIVGSTANNMLIFLGPAIFVIKLDKTKGINCSKINARIILLLGLILISAFFYFQIKK